MAIEPGQPVGDLGSVSAVRQCPLRSESGHRETHLEKSALCQEATYAAQQNSSLFDDFVGA